MVAIVDDIGVVQDVLFLLRDNNSEVLPLQWTVPTFSASTTESTISSTDCRDLSLSLYRLLIRSVLCLSRGGVANSYNNDDDDDAKNCHLQAML